MAQADHAGELATTWNISDINWAQFQAEQVDPALLAIVKAAALVELNGDDYARYLCRVFADDPKFQAATKVWAADEVRHGQALGRWAALADPSFDLSAASHRFRSGYHPPLDGDRSRRGSQAGELIARCIVEVGTSSYYRALGEASREPVLRMLCRRIAADELRHFKLFYRHLQGYLDRHRLGRIGRLRLALARIRETEDDELAYAYYAANGQEETYDRKRWSEAYMRRAYPLYRPRHLLPAVVMTLKAAGFRPPDKACGWLARMAYRYISYRLDRLQRHEGISRRRDGRTPGPVPHRGGV